MTVGRLVDRARGGAADVPRPARAVGAAARAPARRSGPALSMGMSDDFEVAVEEGATIVRVGRALFGERPHDHDGPAGLATGDDRTGRADVLARPDRGDRLVESASGPLASRLVRLGRRRAHPRFAAARLLTTLSCSRRPFRRPPHPAVRGRARRGRRRRRAQGRVTAPAVEGAANDALLRLLADELGVARRDVRIVAGATSRQKLVVVDGVDPDAIVARWPGLRV